MDTVSWFRLKATEGDAAAQSDLGDMYETGRGVTQDRSEAYRWYSFVAFNRLKEAAARRDNLARNMTAAELDAAQRRVQERRA